MCYQDDYGPSFGYNDFWIGDNCKNTKSCSVMFPLTYDFEGATRFPAPNPVDIKAFCGANADGNMDFRVVEYEIYRAHF